MSTVRKQPLRQCIGCNEMKEKKSLIRIIRTEEEKFVLDDTGKKNGRGAYICPNSDCLKKVIKTKALNRAFKTVVDDNVYEELAKELSKIESK